MQSQKEVFRHISRSVQSSPSKCKERIRSVPYGSKELDMGRTEIKIDIVGLSVRYRPDYWIL